MNETVAKGPGHTVVDLSNHIFGISSGGLDDIYRNAEAAKAVNIRRRDTYKGYINGNSP